MSHRDPPDNVSSKFSEPVEDSLFDGQCHRNESDRLGGRHCRTPHRGGNVYCAVVLGTFNRQVVG